MHPTKLLRGSKTRYLENKKILVGLTSSIAIIEAPKLMRELIRHGAEVYCIATEETKKIIGEEALKFGCGNKVYYEITGDLEHISLYNECDLYLIIATANTISKLANKIADNIVTTTYLMFKDKPVLVVPVMHINMYESIKENLDKLKYITPKIEEGKIKIDIERIVKEVIDKIGNKFEKKVLILNGSTVEFIDDVRVITNLSSGKMGIALAEAFLREGYEVYMIMGLGEEVPYYIKSFKVLTSEEMLKKALELGKEVDIIISCAAISDFVPEKKEGKISSDVEEITIKLRRNIKVLKKLRERFKDKIIVGFKAEYNVDEEELIERAKKRLEEYGLDIIIANDLSKNYFGSDNIEAYIIKKYGEVKKCHGSKKEVAKLIVSEVKQL
ncbi:bifunctional phosphopantothenoylcysteine decarboxylase/phosphopantothenate--cysteine ligase CoaBC [Methanocaldococcus infernus]